MKTPPRSQRKLNMSMSTSSPFRTPTRTTSRNLRRSSHTKPRMSPSPTISRYPSAKRLTPPGSSYGSSSGVDRFIPSRRSMLDVDLCRKKLLSDDNYTIVEMIPQTTPMIQIVIMGKTRHKLQRKRRFKRSTNVVCSALCATSL